MTSGHFHTPHKEINGLSLYFSGDIAIIIMNRGENRMNQEFVDAFNILLDEVESKASCKGLITTGKGRFYCNGLDLEWMGNQTYSALEKFFTDTTALIRRLLFYPLPTMAAISGHAFAGGALLALAHDLRSMRTDKGWISLNETRFGGQFSDFTHAFLRVKLGEGKNVTDIVILAHRLTAEDAFNRGIVHAISSEGRLLQESIRVLKSFYGNTGYPRASLVKMKEDVYKESYEIAQKFDPEAVPKTINNFGKILGKQFKSQL